MQWQAKNTTIKTIKQISSFKLHLGYNQKTQPKMSSRLLFDNQKQNKRMLQKANYLGKIQHNGNEATISSSPMKHWSLTCKQANVLCCNLFPCCNTIWRKNLGNHDIRFLEVDIVQIAIEILSKIKNNIHSKKLRNETEWNSNGFVKYNNYQERLC